MEHLLETEEHHVHRGPSVMAHLKEHEKEKEYEDSEDYRKWSIASLFICFIWGILAFRASRKTRIYNEKKDSFHAQYYSSETKKYIISAIATCIVLVIIFGVPLSIALAVQGSITKFPTVRSFFG